MDIKEAVRLALESASKDTEAFASERKSSSVEVTNGELDKASTNRETGIGVRVIDGGKVGFAHTNDLSPESIKQTVAAAEANARCATPDPHRKLLAPVSGEIQKTTVDPTILSDASMDERIAMALSTAREGRFVDERLTNGMTYYSDAYGRSVIGNTAGLLREGEATSAHLYAYFTVAGEGGVQSGFYHQSSPRRSDLLPDVVARTAAERTLRLLGAAPIPTGDMSVIFEADVAVDLLEMLAYSVSSDAVQKGRSLLKGKIGESIASEHVSIVDDGMFPGGVNQAPFDGEGSPAQRTGVVEKGVLKSYLFDSYTAAVDGTAKTTANAVRGYRSTPSVGVTNFVLLPGQKSPDQLIDETESGLLIQTLASGGGMNPISGQFSAGAEGLLIQNGKIVQSVRGVAVAGTLMELLKSIDGVADDLSLNGTVGSPMIRVGRLAVSGV